MKIVEIISCHGPHVINTPLSHFVQFHKGDLLYIANLKEKKLKASLHKHLSSRTKINFQTIFNATCIDGSMIIHCNNYQ
jgi:hypothetical protein